MHGRRDEEKLLGKGGAGRTNGWAEERLALKPPVAPTKASEAPYMNE